MLADMPLHQEAAFPPISSPPTAKKPASLPPKGALSKRMAVFDVAVVVRLSEQENNSSVLGWAQGWKDSWLPRGRETVLLFLMRLCCITVQSTLWLKKPAQLLNENPQATRVSKHTEARDLLLPEWCQSIKCQSRDICSLRRLEGERSMYFV